MKSLSLGVFSFSVLLTLFSSVYTEVYVKRGYEDEQTMKDWIKSGNNPKGSGNLELKAKKLQSDQSKKSLYTGEPAKFYHYSLPLEKPASNVGKDLVLQYALTHEDGITCGGGYLKLLTEKNPEGFDGESPYAIMFGPDVCGAFGQIHLILNVAGKNVLKTKSVPYLADKKSHIYTLALRSNKTYEIYNNCDLIVNGVISEEWDFQMEKTIDDPKDKKPADWVDEPEMDDLKATKPEDHDQPEFIDDPNATKPAEWDDETDGEFIANKLPNPEFKGEWAPPKVKNPKYKGAWEPKKIANPDYKVITDLAEYSNIESIGYDIWAVDAHSHLSHVMLSDDLDAALDECKKILPDVKEYNEKIEEAEKIERDEMAKKANEEGGVKSEDDADEDDDEVDEKPPVVDTEKDEL